jgi:UDP-glucose 4-epimerase
VPRRYVEGRPFDVPVNVLDTALAARTLGWGPKVLFRDGLAKTLESLRRARAERQPSE